MPNVYNRALFALGSLILVATTSTIAQFAGGGCQLVDYCLYLRESVIAPIVKVALS
jgi:hypothetical protein